jgi:hypothetical protein
MGKGPGPWRRSLKCMRVDLVPLHVVWIYRHRRRRSVAGPKITHFRQPAITSPTARYETILMQAEDMHSVEVPSFP